jgi:ankyrin repeat protein
MRKLRKGVAGALALAALLAATPPDAPVADAAMRGDVEAVRALVKQGADVNAAHGDGMTALHWAAENGSVEIAQILVTAGASTSAVTRHGGFTPLHVAARAGRAEVAKALLAAGADPNVTTASGATALHQAAGAGNVETVEALLAKGAQVDAKESMWEQTPLVFAASYNRPDVIKALLKHGADVNTYTRVHSVSGQRAIDQAGAAARRAALEAFKVKDGNDPNWRPTPTQVAAAVRAGQEVQRQGPSAAAGASSEVDLGGGEGAGTAADSQGGLTPLLHATRNGHMEAAIALLDGGADINLPKKGDEYTPITMAMINGNYDLGLMLLQRGADVNKPAADGVAPLFAVISNYWGAKTRYPQPMKQVYQKASHLETMETLLKAGADVNARIKKDQWYLVYTFGSLGVDMAGATPFWRAAHAVDVPAMKLLVKYGADPNIPTIVAAGGGGRRGRGGAGGPDPSGLPVVPPGGPNVYPIHAAAGVAYGLGFTGNFHQHAPNGWLPAVKYLVDELGADVNVRDAGGYNAIHHAASRGDNDMIKFLVEKGGDVMVVSRAGQTTVDLANGPGQRISPIPATIELLTNLGAKNNNRCVSC